GHTVVFRRQLCNFVRNCVEGLARIDCQRRQRTGQSASRVADCQPYTPFADVDSQNTHDPRRYYRFAPNLRFSRCPVRRTEDQSLNGRHYVIAMIHRVKVYSIVGALVACCGLSAQEGERPDTEALSRRAAERLKTLHDEAEQLAAEEKT